MIFSLNINHFQLASVILKQYVEAHWNSSAEKFRPPETTDAVSTFEYTSSLTVVNVNHLCGVI